MSNYRYIYLNMWQELNVSFNLRVYLFILSTMSDLLALHILCAQTSAFTKTHTHIHPWALAYMHVCPHIGTRPLVAMTNFCKYKYFRLFMFVFPPVDGVCFILFHCFHLSNVECFAVPLCPPSFIADYFPNFVLKRKLCI